MKIESFSCREFFQLEDAWRSLSSGNDMTAFQSFEWYRVINEHYLSERTRKLYLEPVFFLVSDADGPLLIAPLLIQKISLPYIKRSRRGCHFFGQIGGYSDYLNFIYRKFSEEAVQLVFEETVKRFRIGRFFLGGVLSETAMNRFLRSLPDVKMTERNAVSLIIPNSAAEYEQSLSKHARQNIRTAHNRTVRDGIQVHYMENDAISPNEAFQCAKMKHMRNAVKRRVEFKKYSPVKRTYARFVRLYSNLFWSRFDEANHAMQTGLGRLIRFMAGSELCGFAYVLEDRFQGLRTLRAVQICVSEKYSWYSPGKICLSSFIKTAADNHNSDRLDVLDFTVGEDSYKYDLGGRNHTYCSFHFDRHGEKLP